MPSPLIVERSDGFYRIPLLEKFGLRAMFTARAYNMGFEANDRLRAFKKMAVDPRRVVCPAQVHGEAVHSAGRKDAGRGALTRATAISVTDAVMTQERSLALAIQTADCLPVFLFDPRQRVIALVHAGWRGVARKIIAKTLGAMKAKYSTEPSGAIAVLGPALKACCYEVGEEFRENFSAFLEAKGRKLYFDIAAAATDQLQKAGVRESRIYDARICTSCQKEDFFSYRREGQAAGRSMSVLEILDTGVVPW